MVARLLVGCLRWLAPVLAGWLVVLAPTAVAADLAEITQLYRTGKYAECVEAAEKALEESPFSENYRVLLLRAELELGRYADALKTLDAGIEKFPSSVQLRWYGRDAARFNNQPERATKLEQEIADLVKQSAWRYSDAANQVVLGKFFLSQGADAKQVLTGTFGELKRRQPSYVEVYLANGELALSKDDYALAGEAFQQAAKLDVQNAEAHFGIARAFAPSDPEKAEAALLEALKINPNHIGALLFVAEEHIDAERYDDADTVLAQVGTINPQHPRSLALQAVLAHLRNKPEKEQAYRAAALKPWATNPEVDHVIGKKLSQKYRFAEGEKYQRAALAMDAKYLPAKMQLASDLLRLGKEDEGWKLADEAATTDAYSVVAYNLVTLQESLAKFRTLEQDGFVLRMDAREADIYGQRVLDLLVRAKAALCPKYDVTLAGPVIVELFPRQQDFAIRTFGLPGGAGFLGVCFGTVITANSPASQGETPACWEATLWHEFCHVVTLNKTHNKMPRWLSEGISVYEERQADPAWGQAMDPQYREMLLGDDLVPMSELSGAFLSPESPLHLQFAYFESSLAVEYLVEKYGLETLKRVLVDLSVGMPINDSLARYAGSLEALDKEFAAYARKQAEAMAPKADWTKPELPQRAGVELVAAWVKEHPTNYAALQALAQLRIAAKDWSAAKDVLLKMKELYPADASASGSYALLAQVHRELKEVKEERAALETLASLVADNVVAYERLCELSAAAEDYAKSRDYALRWLAVNPLMPGPHRYAAAAAEKLHDDPLAIESYRALLLLEPFDPADVHLKLATALQRLGDLQAAKRHALLALEEAPRFRAAHQRLLAIVDEFGTRAAGNPPENPAEKPLDKPATPPAAGPTAASGPAPARASPPPSKPGVPQ
jgi:tetratricopeptide (TPR) repeat protein